MIPTGPVANHLWQSTLFAAASWLVTVSLRRNRAAIRCWIWLAASLKFLIPFSLLVDAGAQLGWRTAPPITQKALPVAIAQFSQPFPVAASLPGSTMDVSGSSTVPALLFAVWCCGFLASGIVWFRWWQRFRAALKQATPLPLGLSIPVMSTPSRLEPGVFGIRKPVLLLPEGITRRLTDAQLHSILAHELLPCAPPR
jgi:beta-lactamase regulating signal transducer with metallopeptidase domain